MSERGGLQRQGGDGAGSTGQTFLVGPDLYLRAPTATDAARAVAWRLSPFPISPAAAEAWLKEQLNKDWDDRVIRLIACRLADDQPVGSAGVDRDEDWPTAVIRLHAAPTLGDEGGQAVKAAMLRLVVPWLTEEHGTASVAADLDGDEAIVAATAEELGLREAYRLREALWRDGRRRDWVTRQRLHPGWLAIVGDPGPGILTAGPPVTAPRSPAPRPWPPSPFPIPPNAIALGERLALCPVDPAAAEAVAQSMLRDPETGFGHPREPKSSLRLADSWGSAGKTEPPSRIPFAIVARETGETIGENGLVHVDWVNRTAETESWLYRPQHRGGLGTEAKHLLLAYTFETLGLHMIWSWVATGNDRSAAALRKQGYRDAGRFDWIGITGGGFRSARLFDLLAEEWRAARG